MPYKSEAQRRKCYAMRGKGKNGSWDCSEWSKETKGKKLPDKVTKKAELTVGDVGKFYSKYLASNPLHQAVTHGGIGYLLGSTLGPKLLKTLLPGPLTKGMNEGKSGRNLGLIAALLAASPAGYWGYHNLKEGKGLKGLVSGYPLLSKESQISELFNSKATNSIPIRATLQDLQLNPFLTGPQKLQTMSVVSMAAQQNGQNSGVLSTNDIIRAGIGYKMGEFGGEILGGVLGLPSLARGTGILAALYNTGILRVGE